MTTAASTARRFAGGALALSLVLAACGDDDGAETRAGVENIGGDSGGSASASGIATGDIDPDATEDGGYEYASNVSAHRLLVLDICDIAAFLGGDSINYGAVDAVYTGGKNSVNADGSVRTLEGFATADDRLHGLDEYFDSSTPLDDFVSAAIDGTGLFADASDAVRTQGIEKGIQNQLMVAWTIHELNTALRKAEAGEFDAESGAPHNWDEAWAFYHGAAPDCAPYATADKRAANFGTLADDGETSLANEAILAAMIDGRDALLAEDLAGVEAAAEAVVRNLVITYGQAAIRYATLAAADVVAGDLDTAAEHQMEGYAFFRVVEALAADAGADVGTVNAILLDGDPGTGGDGDDIRDALAPLFEAYDVTDDDIGTLAEG